MQALGRERPGLLQLVCVWVGEGDIKLAITSCAHMGHAWRGSSVRIGRTRRGGHMDTSDDAVGGTAAETTAEIARQELYLHMFRYKSDTFKTPGPPLHESGIPAHTRQLPLLP